MPMSPASVLNLIDEHIKALAEIAANKIYIDQLVDYKTKLEAENVRLGNGLAATNELAAELETKKEQWKADCYCTLSKLRATDKALEKTDKQLDDANRLVGLATNLREQLRGEHGIAIDGPISSMTKLLWAIKQFDTEYARQYAAAIQEDPPKP